MTGEKKQKTQRVLFGGALVLIVLVFVGAFFFGGSAVQKQAEDIASQTLGVPVDIESVSIDREAGVVLVRKITVANPPGYAGGPAMTIAQMRLVLAENPDAPGVISISEAAVNGGVVNLQARADGTNLMALYGLINNAAGADDVNEAGAPVKMIIGRLEMADARLHPVAVQMNDAPVVTLPDIVLRGVGERQNGVLSSVALGFGYEYLLRVAAQAAGQAGFYQGMSPEAVQAMQRQMNLTPGIVEQFRRDMQELGTGLKNLLQPQDGEDTAQAAE